MRPSRRRITSDLVTKRAKLSSQSSRPWSGRMTSPRRAASRTPSRWGYGGLRPCWRSPGGRRDAGQRQAVAEILARVRREAEGVKDEPRNGNLKPAAFGRLARAHGELGEQGAALLWIEAEPSNLVKTWSLLGLAEGIAMRLPRRTAPASPSKDNALDGDAAQAIAAAVGTRLASPPVRKPSGSFKGRIILFGTQREDRPNTLGIEAMNPDGTSLETILVLKKDASMNTGRESLDGSRLAFDLSRQAGRDRALRDLAAHGGGPAAARSPTMGPSSRGHLTGDGWPPIA